MLGTTTAERYTFYGLKVASLTRMWVDLAKASVAHCHQFAALTIYSMTTTQKPTAATRSFTRSAKAGRIQSYSLSDPAVAGRVADMRAQLASSPEQSLQFLKKVGVLTRSGKLAKTFGG